MLQKRILVIEKSNEITEIIKKMYNDANLYSVICYTLEEENYKKVMKEFPDIIIINSDDNAEIYKKIGGSVSGFMTPVIALSTKSNKENIIDSLSLGIDHYIAQPVDEQYLYYTIQNALKLIYNNRTASPLTGLPGNVQITNEITRRLSKKTNFFVLYIDLDNFKAYNDTYGFLKGDEVIKLTAEVILSAISEFGNRSDFVGHIGGDDFVAITSNEDVDKIANNILKEFDEKILSLLKKNDIDRGFFEVPNRKGVIEQYPLTSISVAGVTIRENDKLGVLEIGELGAQVKHKAKSISGSSYYMGKRINKGEC